MSRGLNSCNIQECWSDVQIQNNIINAEIEYFTKHSNIHFYYKIITTGLFLYVIYQNFLFWNKHWQMVSWLYEVNYIYVFLYSHCARFNIWTSYKEWDSNIELKGKRLALDEAKLTQMVSMVWCVNDVCVVQLSKVFQLLIDLKM